MRREKHAARLCPSRCAHELRGNFLAVRSENAAPPPELPRENGRSLPPRRRARATANCTPPEAHLLACVSNAAATAPTASVSTAANWFAARSLVVPTVFVGLGQAGARAACRASANRVAGPTLRIQLPRRDMPRRPPCIAMPPPPARPRRPGVRFCGSSVSCTPAEVIDPAECSVSSSSPLYSRAACAACAGCDDRRTCVAAVEDTTRTGPLPATLRSIQRTESSFGAPPTVAGAEIMVIHERTRTFHAGVVDARQPTLVPAEVAR